MKSLFRVLAIARLECQYLVRSPKVLFSMLAITLVPAGYALIYLFSMWDPLSHIDSLPVLVVNNDRGIMFHNQAFNVGQEVVNNLQDEKRFAYQLLDNEEQARREVRQGKAAFALVIPPDFSANAVPGAVHGGAKPVIYTSEGNNYQSASMARHFSEVLATQINENLNERRWAIALETAVGSQHSVERLKNGVFQLDEAARKLNKGAEQTAQGAHQLAGGHAQLDQGLNHFTDGFKQLSEGLRTLDAKRPRNADLNRLKRGADDLEAGHAELNKGLTALHDGAIELRQGAERFRDETLESLFAPAALGEAATKFAAGLGELDKGLGEALEGERQLAEGATALSNGVDTLTSGVRTTFNTVHQVVQKLPEDAQLDELRQGGKQLSDGAQTLATANQQLASGSKLLASGISQLRQALPADLNAPAGNARGLAHSVEPQIEVAAPVANSGASFAANIIPAALWLGASVAAFLLHTRVMPRQARRFSRPVKLLGKLTLPALTVFTQTVFVLITALLILQMKLFDPLSFSFCVLASGLTFLLIIFALTLTLGDIGKGLAMILLAIQLSSSGGILPLELSGDLFMQISPWLPLTWVIKAMKASMFGAYDGDWLFAMSRVLCFGAGAFLLGCVAARWRYVRPKISRVKA